MLRILITISFIAFLGIRLAAQTDTSAIRINRLTYENVIERQDEGEITVVSASRSTKKIEDLPVTIHVITSEEIILKGYITLVDVLKSLPGIKASQSGSAENGQMFLMRGLLGNQYAKILVDNIPIKPSVSIAVPIEAQLPIRQAERIEVIYGPSSAIFGADAAIGVINIITKKPKSSVFANADVIIGSNQFRYTNFTVGGKAGRNKNILEYSFFGSFMEMQNMNIFDDSAAYHPLSYLEQQGLTVDFPDQKLRPTQITQSILDQYGIPQETFFHGMTNYEGSISMPELAKIPTQSNLFGFNLKYKKWDFSYLNMYRKTHSSLGLSPYLYKYNSPQYYLADYNQKVTINYNSNIRKINSNTNVMFSGYKLDENSSRGVNFIPEITKAYQFAASYELNIDQVFIYNYKFAEILGGFSSQFSTNLPLTNYSAKPYSIDFEIEPSTKIAIDTVNYANFGYNPHAFINASAFIQLYLNFNKFKIVGGVRKEFNTLFEEDVFTPRLAMLYSLNSRHSFRLSTGKAYKAPSGDQLFQSVAFPYSKTSGTDTIYYALIPNPKLLPEYFSSHEFGYRGNFFDKKVYVDFAFCYNEIENLIVSKFTKAKLHYSNAFDAPEGDYTRILENTKEALTQFYSIDLAVTLKDVIESKHLDIKLSGNYTYGSEELSTGEHIKYVRGIPNYMFKINLSGNPFRKFYMNVENTIMGPWYRSFLPFKEYYKYDNYSRIDGYFTTDLTVGFRAHKNMNISLQINNLFDARYGGIDATATDADLQYNPQMGTNFRIGMNFIMN